MSELRSPPVADGRLEITLEIDPAVTMERVPMRRALLHFRNVGPEPVRIYLPNPDAFRLLISTLAFVPGAGPPLIVPDPHPHGYVVTEADFHLLAPGEVRSFPQSFTLDPFVPGGGMQTRRRAGFEAGQTVRVSWTYENSIRRWEGGRMTADGPTQQLFGGQDIPFIWTGELRTELTWTVR
jgi:hypothetical protein